MNLKPEQPISLALSGGGTRAMAYHLGVLKWMAESRLLERVTRISTVSGGSLLMGFIYKSNDFRWPTSRYFLDKTLPEVSELICGRSLQAEALSQLFWPPNFRYCLSRANLVAIELNERWGFNVPMSHLPSGPEWSIQGTNAQNGKRFRFKGAELGDYDIGYADVPDFPLSHALAVSAAFPVGIGPLTINTRDYDWRVRPFNAPFDQERVRKPSFETLQLYDGGLYDNLGLESFFDLGTQESKHRGDYIVVSDAGAPLTYGMSWGPLSPERVKRMMDIMSDQQRALRVRALVNYFKGCPSRGAFVPIDTNILGHNCPEARFAKTFPTSLERFSRRDFDRLQAHGYAAASKASEFGFYRPHEFPVWLDRERAQRSLRASRGLLSIRKSWASSKKTSALPPLAQRNPATDKASVEFVAPESRQPTPYTFFEAIDVRIARWLEIGRWAKETLATKASEEKSPGEALSESFSPTVVALGVGALLFVFDRFFPALALGHERLDGWARGVANEISPLLFTISLAVAASTPVLSFFPWFRRRANYFLGGIARLAQDAAMFALGTLGALTIRETIWLRLTWENSLADLTACGLLISSAVVMFCLRRYAMPFVRRSSLSVSGWAFGVVVGVWFLVYVVPAMLAPIERKEAEREKNEANPRLVVPTIPSAPASSLVHASTAASSR